MFMEVVHSAIDSCVNTGVPQLPQIKQSVLITISDGTSRDPFSSRREHSRRDAISSRRDCLLT